MSLIKELSHRDGLQIALGGRDERSLEPILFFLFKNINNPEYSKTLVDVSTLVLGMYSSVMSQSVLISELLFKLSLKVKEELKVQKSMTRVLGLLESLFAVNASSRSVSTAE